MTIDELVAKCKGSVKVEYNEHRDTYETKEQVLMFFNAKDDVYARLKDAETFVSLHFYPHTPVGFYRIYGASLDDCLAQVTDEMF